MNQLVAENVARHKHVAIPLTGFSLSMSESYRNPPVVEAAIELRVTMPPAASLNDLSPLLDTLRLRYPESHNVMRTEFTLADESAPGNAQIGYQLINADRTEVVSLSMQGLAFSRLAPYQGWSVLRDQARRLWNEYSRAMRVTHVTRAGMRYINQITIPEAQGLDDYLTVVPPVPEYAQRESAKLFLQFQIPQPDLDCTLIVNIAQAGNPAVLDIDLFRESHWNTQEDAALWSYLEDLRIRKNKIFESTITERTREVIR